MRGDRPNKERRAAERVACKDVLLSYETEGGFWASLFGKASQSSKPVPVRNISRGGVCFLAKQKLVPGGALTMTVRFGPRRPTVTVKGEVIWTASGEGRYPHKIGVGFIDVDQEAWEVLSKAKQIVQKKQADWQSWRLRSEDRTNRPLGALDLFEDEK